MAGHSKWANIKNKKAAQDKKRSNIFMKLSRDISVAARQGSDPNTNFRLRMAIEKAKKANMPKENIERAIKRGSGEIEGEMIEEILYEAFGPGGCAILIETATDNKNRTSTNIRTILNKLGCNLGGVNSVKWMFEHLAIFKIDKTNIKDIDEFILKIIDIGAKDVIDNEKLIIMANINDFQKIHEFLTKNKIPILSAELEYIPTNTILISDEDSQKLDNIIKKLLDIEEVKNVYDNRKTNI